MSRVRITLGALLALGVTAVPAGATTIARDPDHEWMGRYVQVIGDPARPNATTLTPVTSNRSVTRISERLTGMTVRSDAGPLSERMRCVAVLADALCTATDSGTIALWPVQINATFGSGADTVDASALPDTDYGFDMWALGAGDDRFAGGTGTDFVFPGPGDDIVSGAEYVYYSGAGIDGVRVTLDGVADDGERGTGSISGPVIGIEGTAGDDVLAGDERRQTIRGLGGRDEIDGDGGPDELHSEGGTVRGDDGDDLLLARAHDAPIAAEAGAGADDIRVTGTQPVTVTCGDGHDRVSHATGADVTVAADCEDVATR